MREVPTLPGWVEERKSRVRHVRTPEGAAHYGQPIGSIIKDDGVGSSVVDAARSAKDIYSLNPHYDVETDNFHYWVPGYDKVRVQRMNGAVSVKHDGKVTFNKEIGVGDFAARQMAVRAVQYHYGDKSWQRSDWDNTDNFMDYWNGIYGKDWALEGDDEAFDWYDGGVEQRWGAVMDYADELGIKISDNNGDMDIDVAEMIVNMHAAYEEMYPGFSNVQKYYGLGSDSHGAIAYNYPMAKVTNGTYTSGYSPEHGHIGPDYKGGSLNLSPKYFGDGRWKGTGKSLLDTQKMLSVMSNWIVKPKRRDDEGTLDSGSWFAMQTFHHETGHTIGYITLGAIGPETDYEYNDWAREAIANLFVEYGIIEKENEMEVGVPLPKGRDAHMEGKLFPQSVNTYALSQHLSTYGTTNWHEMMAEAWSEYMLSDKPSAFAYDLAKIMEQALLEHLGSI